MKKELGRVKKNPNGGQILTTTTNGKIYTVKNAPKGTSRRKPQRRPRRRNDLDRHDDDQEIVHGVARSGSEPRPRPEEEPRYTARLLIGCADRPGIVAAVSGFLFERGANIVSSHQYSSDPTGGRFFLRTEFFLRGPSSAELGAGFREAGRRAFGMDWEIRWWGQRRRDGDPRLAPRPLPAGPALALAPRRARRRDRGGVTRITVTAEARDASPSDVRSFASLRGRERGRFRQGSDRDRRRREGISAGPTSRFSRSLRHLRMRSAIVFIDGIMGLSKDAGRRHCGDSGACTGGAPLLPPAAICASRRGSEVRFPIARTLGNCLSTTDLARLARLIGASRVKDMIFTSRLFDAKEALEIGFPKRLAKTGRARPPRSRACGPDGDFAPLTLRATKEGFRRIQARQRQEQDDDLVLMCLYERRFSRGHRRRSLRSALLNGRGGRPDNCSLVALRQASG